LFSGGEPLARQDLPRLVAHATARGLRAALSTNGTLLDADLSPRLRDAGLTYAGISVDGDEGAHNRLRRDPGAYRKTLAGLRAARRAGLRVGLRHTLTRDSLEHIEHLFNLMETEDVQRLCFYHLVPTGRAGETNQTLPLTGEETRRAVDEIIDRTAGMTERGVVREVLTVDNHADGVHVYLRLLRENPDRAREALALLSANGGNRSGSAIACVGWEGAVHPDQFWCGQVLGNIRERRFSSIWSDPSPGLLSQLRDRDGRVGGRCSRCRHFSLCRGNLRARAEALTGDPWASDPGCYLTEDEILPEKTSARRDR
jgi:radical SAM protein with 4Fe4S-binding SPASM domain